ncbi:uncharacterized protein LOC132735543 [Ruditapes philippinarum]|uniref:uncharacterized protein LOC132735543 n=1 Tax=Ruditapes philippinarum TaxID=129788 RepID=UPI00295B852F|nr:uncharacterized protein LOC132735543 [Ruditapes philippinarum]
MNKRVQESRRFLRRFRSNPDYVITTDETWLYFRDPETEAQSAVWRQAGSPPPVKARVGRSAGKQMYMMFADCRGMLLCHAVPVGTTINADYYSKVLNRDFIRALSTASR